MKKVLIINDGNSIGGGVIVTNRIVNYIREHYSSDVDIKVLSPFDGLEDLPKERKISVRVFNIFDEYLFYPTSFIRLIKSIREVDIVHFHNVWTFSSLIPLFLSFLLRKIIISTQHAMPGDPCKKGIQKVIMATRHSVIIQCIALIPKTVVFLTNAQKNEFLKRTLFKSSLSKKSIIIPNCLSKSYLQKKQQVSQKRMKLLYVGRLSYSKGFDTMLALITELGLIDCCYTIVGKVKEDDLLMRMKRLQEIGYPVTYVEVVESNDMVCYYDSNDVLIVPSCSEVSPLVVLEAKARGLSIVISDIPGMNECVVEGENGFRFTLLDAKEAACKVRALRNDSGLMHYISENNNKNAEAQTLDKIVPQVLELYS
ncbi:glycosyltransferase [Patescibacteria group bacterium]|nr:glycosyltransferase [Patescibacteria group bacterium]